MPAGKAIYIPKDLQKMDLQDPESQWSYHRMACTENFAIFWEKGFGADLANPPQLEGHNMAIDLPNLMEKLEQFYTYFRDTLQFTRPVSKADKYRMLVMLNYSLEGTAYGGDYDRQIGALWVAPNRIQDKKLNCIAHELGHSFQAQITCDGQGEAWGGCGFFEMTSQWMLWQVNPEWITDEKYHWEAFIKKAHHAYLHLTNIYHSPYILEYWGTKHGLPFIAELYRQGKRGDDPVITYKQLTGLTQEEFCDEMFDACRHFINWDFERTWKETRPYTNQYTTKLEATTQKDWYRVAPKNCPENYGFNAIPLQVPEAGKTISITFEGITKAEEYHLINTDKAGWRYGFVAVTTDGTSMYGETGNKQKGTISFTTPKDKQLAHLWLVVMGAPTEHWMNPMPPERDAQWPYQIKIVNDADMSLTSPNNRIKVEIQLGNSLSYSVLCNGKEILSNSNIGIVLEDGTVLGHNPQVRSKKVKKTEDNIESPFYRFNRFVALGNELDLKFKDNYGVIFRVYNDGVTYRFYTTNKQDITIRNEIAEFNFNRNYTAYLSHSTNEKEPFAMAFQNIYEAKPLSQSSEQIAFLPATVDLKDGLKITLLESDLEAYPGMFLKAEQNSLKGIFAPLPEETAYYPWRMQEYITKRSENIAQVKGTRTYPWRILAITGKDADMPVNNLVYTLASANRIGDTSWITPGKASWEWWNDWGTFNVDFAAGINMETYKYHIDFASRYGLEYVILDEGWYEPKSGDMMTVIPELDLPTLVKYADSKGVKLILWTVFNVLDTQLEEACSYYGNLGIAGFKVDFLDRDDQHAVEMVYRIAEATARHKLLLNLHGMYKPTGLNRTFPHIVNFEGVFGMEEAKWSAVEKDMPQYDVTFPFIRMMAGPVDFTPGAMRNATKRDFKPIYNNPMSQGTRCHQLAMYVVYDSPLTMLADAPTWYEREPEYTRFLASIPTDADETKVIAAQMGEYIVTARRKENTWYIGGLTNWTSRTLPVDFSFLPPGRTYQATIYADGTNAHKQAADYRVYTQEVTHSTQLEIELAAGGGFAMQLTESIRHDEKPGSVPSALGLFPFYKKYVDADGIPIVSSERVEDEALMRSGRVITQILSKRADIKQYMVAQGCKVMIIGREEEVCDIPEYAHICNTPENIAYWNRRARGFGGSPEHDFSASCGEENVLGLTTDRYLGESILVHEFAHIFHLVGICGIEPGFNDRLEALRQSAIAKGLWKDTYCISNKEEYFAETVQSFFNCNRYAETPNGVHNAINTRAKLKRYDPDMYRLLLEYLPEIDLEIP